MSKIQIESSCSSTSTHRITQPSTTLNRRYVRRPMNIAIEEAARSANQPARKTDEPVAPSRLVNLGVRTADLEAVKQREQAEAARVAATKAAEEAKKQAEQAATSELVTNPVALIPNVVEFGCADETATLPAVVPPAENMNIAPASQPDTAPTTKTEVDTTALAMNIAADYAAASLSASIKEYGDGYQGYVVANPNDNTPATVAPNTNDSVDAIAQAASAAIASIRTATAPDQVSEQIASLQTFADNIRSNHDTPEMRELGDTISKFIDIAKKSTKVQEANDKSAKVTLSSKANRAATKVTKSSAKVMAVSNRNRTKMNNLGTVKAPARPVRSVSPARMPARRLSAEEVRANAMEQALHNVATMDDPKSKANRSRAVIRPRKKAGFKRFAIAFTCAAACVGGLIAFVGANMPDISVRVAAMQTGIQAVYPSYVPRDYALGDIFSEDGKISMIFDGPAGASFTLIEEKSSWDSSALLRNYVEPTWGQEYATTHEQGITIYISNANSDAAWVNGGVLYKINSKGTALTKKQVRSIVTSL